jgi:predicted TIM-barrel fold metal-dependent hydrolase
MDRDGVETQVIFGPIFQISTDDPVLRQACYRVYNDWLLEELDYRHWRLREAKEFWADKGGIALETKPSELFKRQIYATFQEDGVALALVPFFGEGHLLWASDYPHPDSVWPSSRAAIERQMAGLPAEMRQKLTHDNAAKLYGLR